MNYLKPALLVAVVSMTAGCTTVKGWFTDQDSKTTAEKFHQTVKSPDSLDIKRKSEEFKLPDGTARAEKSVYITSPYSVLEILPGSWINNDDPHPYKIMLERPQKIDDFDAFLKSSIKSFVAQNNFTVIEEKAGNHLVIEAIKTIESGMWFWTSNDPVEKFLFELKYEVKPHGRSAALWLEPISLKLLDDEYVGNVPLDHRKKQVSINMVNRVSVELDYQYRVVVQNNRAEADVTIVMGKNSAKQDVITSQRDINYVYDEMEDILEDLGFEITEEDKTLFVYSLKYNKNETSLWRSLFASEFANKLDLPKGNYEVILITSINGVHMLFTDEEGTALSKSQVEQIYNQIMAIVEDQDLEI